jgi:hypothetical protein
MSIGFQNYDSSFFQIEVEGLKNTTLKKDISDRIINLEVVEEMGKIITGNIQMVDDDDLKFTNVLKGKKINVKWGYSKIDISGMNAFRKQNNPKELFSPELGLVNRYASGTIMNPSGGGDENGVFTYNCSFYGREYYDKTTAKMNRKIFSSGTKTELIAQIFTDMGIKKFYINFRRGDERLSKDTAVTKGESNFRFLSKCAQEWRALFKISTNNKIINPSADPPEYEMVGIFCNYDDDVSRKSFLEQTLGTSGDSSTFDYKLSGSPNVKSYTWQFHQGESGAGDNVRIGPGGEFYYMKADTEKVTYYKLDAKKMKSELSKQGDITKQTAWLKEKFKQAENGMENLVQLKYFVSCDETTAPQGIGLSAQLECIGNPLLTVPARAVFGVGFPDVFNVKKGLTFYQVRVSHKINRAGYMCSVQIADAFTTSGGSLVG